MTEYAKLVLAVDSTQAVGAAGDLKTLESQGGKTESSMASLGNAAKIAGAAIAAAAAATVGMVAASVQAADAAGEAAQSAGVTTAEFTRLQYAMQFDGAPENLGQSMKFLNKAVADAAVGAGNNAEMFAAMGVSIRNQDGTLRSSHDVLLQVSDRFAGMEDGAQKAALATDIFGKAGADMIPFLNNGAAGIAALEAEADQLGITIDDKTAAAAGHLNDTFGRLKSAGAGLANQVMVAMMPALTGLGDEMAAAATNSGAMEMAGKALVVILKSVLTAAVVVAAAFQAVGQTIGATAAAAVQVASGDFRGAFETMKAGAANVGDSITSAMARVDGIWNASAATVEAAEARKVAAIHATAAATAPATAATGAAGPAGPVPPEGAVVVTPLSGMYEATAQQAVDVDALLDEIYPSFLEKQQAYEQQSAQLQAATNQAKRLEALGHLGDMASVFAGQSKTMLIAQKAAALPAAFLAIKTGMAQALALPFPANLGAMAKVASVGKGVYDSIKSIGGGGGGGGAIGAVSGGISLGATTGGGASVAPQAAPARQPTTDIRLVGIRPDDMISGSYLQKIIAGIGETLADNGGRMGKVELVMSA